MSDKIDAIKPGKDNEENFVAITDNSPIQNQVVVYKRRFFVLLRFVITFIYSFDLKIYIFSLLCLIFDEVRFCLVVLDFFLPTLAKIKIL